MSSPPTPLPYDSIGVGYAKYRRPDPRIAAVVHAGLGDARFVVNVGAGAGAYEPTDRYVIAVEPSAVMRAQRPAHAPPAISASAEALPLDDQSVDAAMATFTIHHWRDLDAGLSELKRVARGPIAILTFDPEAFAGFWVHDYLPELMPRERATMPAPAALASKLGGGAYVESVSIPRDCTDGFNEAYYARPEMFLDADARAAQSVWAAVGAEAEARSVARLRADLESGAWDRKHARWRELPSYDGALRLVVRPG